MQLGKEFSEAESYKEFYFIYLFFVQSASFKEQHNIMCFFVMLSF